MKNFQNYMPEKYATAAFQEVEEGIYRTKSPYDDKEIFVTSLSFEMEPERFGEEDASPRNLTQIPIEGILDEFPSMLPIFTTRSMKPAKPSVIRNLDRLH